MSNLSQSGSSRSRGVGNTKRPPLARHWCFTWNNYKSEDIIFLLGVIGSNGPNSLWNSKLRYVFQEERGESGTPHLQGYIDFGKRRRPMEGRTFPNCIHWEVCRSPKHSMEYCRKNDSRVGDVYTNIEFAEEVEVVDEEEMHPWQKGVLNILDQPRDPRKVYWIFDYEGNSGKTQLSKYLVVKRRALVLGGKANDLKYGVLKYMEKHGVAPKIIIFDVPRCSQDFISYQGIEEVKNGLFFSGKYESDMVVYNPPHVICFANNGPIRDKLSKDRWCIKEIRNKKLVDS